MLIYFLYFLFETAFADLIVYTNSGPVQGVPSLEKDVEAFLGIPYAEPPVGELRFAKPVPKKKWQDVYKAANLPPPCIQIETFPYHFMPDVTSIKKISEDCLYLNIWAPKADYLNRLRPVIIFFHHGAFMSGSSNTKVFDGSRLANRGDVVVVTFNYRLGSLGFFLAYTEEAEGNMAMYDQIMVIKWMKENAKFFGGDPENVVLMGSSAGSLSVSAHMVSPLSKNLFRRVILQSGSLLTPLYEDNTLLFDSSRMVTGLIGCTNKSMNLVHQPQTALKCLRSKPAAAFAEVEKIIFVSSPIRFYPRIGDEFLPKKYVDLVREGKFRNDVELLTGVNNDEGALFLVIGMSEYLGAYGRNYEKMSKARAVALSKGAALISGRQVPPGMSEYYLGNAKNATPSEYTRRLANVLGDASVACSTVFLADIASARGNKVYFYKFGFRSPSSPMAEWAGVTHLDELQYVFGNPYHGKFTPEEIELSNSLIDHWSAFARTGNPNVPGKLPWLQYSYQNPIYRHFGEEEENARSRPIERCEFWRKRFHCEVDEELIRSFTSSAMTTSRGTDPSKNFNLSSFLICISIGLFFSVNKIHL